MALVNRSGRIMDASYSSTAAITSDDFSAHQASTSTTIYIISTQSGTFTVQYVSTEGIAYNLPGAISLAASANTVARYSTAFHLPWARIVFTPDAATAGTVKVFAYADA